MVLADPDAKKKRLLSGALLAVICLITLAAGYARFYGLQFGVAQQDEEIARAVVSKVLRTHEPDTNWIRTDVVKNFRGDSYNFSSYYLFATVVEMGLRRGDDDLRNGRVLVAHVREISAWLGALCVFLAGILAWRLGGRVAGLSATVLTASSVMLYADSLYARPEPFVTFLSMLLLVLLTSRRMSRWLVLALAGLLLGFLVASKVTFLMYLPFPLLLAPCFGVDSGRDGEPDPQGLRWAAAVLAYFVAMAAGFYLGAPYAVHYPWEYLHGLGDLLEQYRLTVYKAGVLSGLVENGIALIYTLGIPALLLAGIGLLVLILHRRWRELIIVLGPLLTLVYFMGASAIFERNFSHALPVVFVLAGLGIARLASLIKRPGALRTAVAALLLAGAAVVPATVLAKLIHPALDGAHQRQVDAETTALSQGGKLMVFPVFGYADRVNGPFCGSYIYMERYFDSASLGQANFVPRGYTIIGVVESVFGGRSISTLQLYYSPSYVYFVPPGGADCELELEPLLAEPPVAAVHARVKMTGDWSLGGARAAAPPSWTAPLYGSWSGSDAHTGTIQIGPFHACGDVVIPVTAGKEPLQSSLEIRERGPKGETVVFSGVPPTVPHSWELLRLRRAGDQCGSYTLSARDDGTGWEDWIGLGQPFASSGTH